MIADVPCLVEETRSPAAGHVMPSEVSIPQGPSVDSWYSNRPERAEFKCALSSTVHAHHPKS